VTGCGMGTAGRLFILAPWADSVKHRQG
jgi:hypothetical protein